jgi:hypothetical protein
MIILMKMKLEIVLMKIVGSYRKYTVFCTNAPLNNAPALSLFGTEVALMSVNENQNHPEK